MQTKKDGVFEERLMGKCQHFLLCHVGVWIFGDSFGIVRKCPSYRICEKQVEKKEKDFGSREVRKW